MIASIQIAGILIILITLLTATNVGLLLELVAVFGTKNQIRQPVIKIIPDMTKYYNLKCMHSLSGHNST